MWEMDPSTPISLAVLIFGYAGVALWLKRTPTPRQLFAYGCGVVALFLALTGPLQQLVNERSFAIYIFQQMVLVFIAPPLLMAGTPDWMLRPVLLNRFIEPVARWITRPLVVFLLFSSVFTLIHFPLVCDRVCHIHPFYGDVDTLLIVTGLLLWFPILSPLPEYPRLPYPLQVLFIFMLTIPMTAVAAPITMAGSVLYTFYVEGPHPLGLSPMSDQVIGGIIMWVGQGVYLMFVFSAIFFRWARSESDEIPPINRRPIPARIQPLRPDHRPLA